jgi:GNAT superfamily N-acetyltransferase
MRIVALAPADLPVAAALLERALPHDRIAVVAREKLFGGDGARAGTVLGAFDGGALAGVIAIAGRWVKLLAVDEPARRRGIGTALLEKARAHANGGKLRIFDHPGNYLSPGVDVRYGAARAFLEARGFVATGEVENIRAPLDDNPLVSGERAASLAEDAARAGYVVRRATLADRDRVSAFVAAAFAPVWAYEVGLALDGPRHAVHVAWAGDQPVAFAAADGNNRGLGWFGPAGTLPEHRGKRLGEALLIACLRDVHGLPEGGVIAWIGPKPFYAKACGAVDDRRFTAFEERA